MVTKKSTGTTKVKAKRTKKKAVSKKTLPDVTPEERWHMISVAAYYMAEKRGFASGDSGNDWLDAETEIDSILEKRRKAM